MSLLIDVPQIVTALRETDNASLVATFFSVKVSALLVSSHNLRSVAKSNVELEAEMKFASEAAIWQQGQVAKVLGHFIHSVPLPARSQLGHTCIIGNRLGQLQVTGVLNLLSRLGWKVGLGH